MTESRCGIHGPPAAERRGSRPSNPTRRPDVYFGATPGRRPRRDPGANRMKKFFSLLAVLAIVALPGIASAQPMPTSTSVGSPAQDTARAPWGARGIWMAGASIGAGLAVIGAGRGIGQIGG